MCFRRLCSFAFLGVPLTVGFLGATQGDEPKTPKWIVKQLALDANEGCAIGDLDGNGSLDIVAGRNWYPPLILFRVLSEPLKTGMDMYKATVIFSST